MSMNEPQTFIEQYLQGLMQSEKDHLSEIAYEALDLMTPPLDPAGYKRLHEIMIELQPMLQAMAQDGYSAPTLLHPPMVNGRYKPMR